MRATPRTAIGVGGTRSGRRRWTGTAATPTAERTRLPETIRVLDAFHVVRLGNHVVDEARRQVQQTLGLRCHRG